MSNKKSQFYLFTAIILCASLFAIASALSQKTKETDNFETIKDNFEKESSFVVNSAIYDQTDVSQRFNEFTEEFIDYAETKGNNLEILYLLVRDDIEINNYLNSEIRVGNKSLNRGEKDTIEMTGEVIIEAYDNYYVFSINNEHLQIKSLLRAEKNNNIQVHIIE